MPTDPTKEMVKVFEKYRHKYDAVSLFERFMEYVCAGFDITFSAIDRPFNQEEGQVCAELFTAWVLTMNEILKSKEWYDVLGEVYMNYIAGTMKKHWTGQYFTPMHICDFMARITDPGENGGESVMDCACGSGRMLLAANAVHPGNYCCAQDLDRICCLMTVCNFIIHGINGEVVCGDSLNPADYRDGWRTNEILNITGVPSVRKMDKMESRSYRNGLLMLQEAKDGKEKTVTPSPQMPKSAEKTKNPQPIQYTLFE